jgi:thermostable 8-oxoguanine DNA glycosylase
MRVDKDFIEDHLAYYEETQGVLPQRLASFGETYHEQGFLTQEQLYDIAYESSTRSAYHVKKNPKKRCKTVTGIVYGLDDDFSRVALLTSLKGFKAPTASCVLAAQRPGHDAVVDTRVWASLDRLGYLDGRKESFNADDYVTMKDPIRRIADNTGRRPVDVGYALFAYDDKVREGTLH